MCHLSVPWQPPGNPPKDLQVVFDGFLHVFAKCGKKKSENQAAQKCSISDWVLCETAGFEALRLIFSESTCLDVPP